MADAHMKPGTHALPPQEIPADRLIPVGTGALRTTMDYIPLPVAARRQHPLKQPWRIVIVYPNKIADVIGVELYDDVILGRTSGSTDSPDLDLSAYDAVQRGVSRRHALLRPTDNQLFLIDLGSTNGTLVNMVPYEKGMARALRHNDTLSLGQLHLTIKIIDRPGGVAGRH